LSNTGFAKLQRKTVATGLCWLSALLLGVFTSSSVSAEPDIHALRSAYLYYFSHFISWPDDSEFPQSELNLCVRTDDKKDQFQLTTIDNKSLGANTLKIVLLAPRGVSALASCHMLYVAEEHREWLAAIRPEISVRTLLITEGLLDERGVIHLFMQNSKLKFSIDNRSLVDRNFKASSKLLRLSVRNGA